MNTMFQHNIPLRHVGTNHHSDILNEYKYTDIYIYILFIKEYLF
jgi:hypothetical protein